MQLRAALPPCVVEKPPSRDMSLDAFKNGLVIVRLDADGRHTFGTRGLHPCPFARSGPWQEMASKLEVVLKKESRKIACVRAGDTGLEKLGSGTYNLVMRMRPGEGHFALPAWLIDVVSAALGRAAMPSEDVALRITRNDCGDFPVLATIAGEVHNAVFASMNGIGPPLFAVAPLPAVKEHRTARYASVQVMRVAHCDLNKAFEYALRREDGVDIAIKLVHLLWDASIRGVMFVDIKPGNILGYQTSRGLSFRLADTDPQFFLVMEPEKRDWRALLLANLALLVAHVRNIQPPSDVTDAFCAAVRPVLVELLNRRGEYDSLWLFEARTVEVSFQSPKDHGDFSLQRMFCTMATSYFFGRALHDCPSSSWPHWDREHQAALDEFWKRPANLTGWPPNWAPAYRPLVQQLVEFATGAL